jgi:hypothetical protein
MLRDALLVLLCLAAVPGGATADDSAVLPDVSVYLKAARYVPAEEDLHWQGSIGAGAGLLRVAKATVYFTADVETIIGNSLRAFEANQANYHLEAGLRLPAGRHEVALNIHHVSRHYVDRPKIDAVDWNVLAVRVSGRFGDEARPLRYSASVGHTTLASLVGYRFELMGHADRDVAGSADRALYVSADARFVTAKESIQLPRGGFLDLAAEAGVRFIRDARELDLFAAVERRNDVFLEAPGRRDRALLGFRVTAGGFRPHP